MKPDYSSIKTARDLVNNGFLVLDVETTGLAKDAEIVEIAVLDPTGETIFHTLIKPLNPISDDVIAIHGITNEMVRDAPTFADIANTLFEILNNQNLVAHNAYFDRKRLEYELLRCGLSLYATWKCTMLLSTPKGHKWNKLIEALEQFNIDIQGVTHRALHDAECCRQILLAISKKPISKWS